MNDEFDSKALREEFARMAARKSMAKAIMKYENASSEEEALLKAEIAFRRSRPRGWGDDEYKAFYSRRARAAK